MVRSYRKLQSTKQPRVNYSDKQTTRGKKLKIKPSMNHRTRSELRVDPGK